MVMGAVISTTCTKHSVVGGKTPGEIHFVFGEGSTPKAVFGEGSTPKAVFDVPLVTGGYSTFFRTLLRIDLHWPGIEDRKTHVELALDFSEFFNNAHTDQYWSYSGSLTTPPCTEGIRWFVSGFQHAMSSEEFVKLSDVSIDSTRDVQKIDRQLKDSSLDEFKWARHEDM